MDVKYVIHIFSNVEVIFSLLSYKFWKLFSENSSNIWKNKTKKHTDLLHSMRPVEAGNSWRVENYVLHFNSISHMIFFEQYHATKYWYRLFQMHFFSSLLLPAFYRWYFTIPIAWWCKFKANPKKKRFFSFVTDFSKCIFPTPDNMLFECFSDNSLNTKKIKQSLKTVLI